MTVVAEDELELDELSMKSLCSNKMEIPVLSHPEVEKAGQDLESVHTKLCWLKIDGVATRKRVV
jgi:hypothetical protein